MDYSRNIPADDDITVIVPVKDRKFSSVGDAARALANFRHGRGRRPPESPAASEPDCGCESASDLPMPTQSADRGPGAPAQAEPEQDHAQEAPAQVADAAPPDEVRGETPSADPDARPPIEPPRSWTKDDKELFKSLPRETQERIAERERLRESDFLRRQNESADKLKALAAREQAAA